jgi:hypothetical protein
MRAAHRAGPQIPDKERVDVEIQGQHALPLRLHLVCRPASQDGLVIFVGARSAWASDFSR